VTPAGAERAAPPVVPPGVLAWAVGLVAALVLAYLFRGLVAPLVLAAVAAYFLNPLVAWLQAHGIRRSVAVTGLFAVIAAALLLAGLVLVPRARAEGTALVANLPELTARLEATLGRALEDVVRAYPVARRVVPRDLEREGWLEAVLVGQAGHASALLGHAGFLVLVLVLVPLFTFFLLRDAGRLLGWAMDRLHPVHVETTVAVWCEIDRIIGRYLRGLALDGLVIGALAGLGLWLLGVPYPLLLAGFTALVNPIPYLGTVLSVSAAGLVALGAGQGLGQLGWIVALYALVRLIDDAVVAVVTIGGSVHLHPMLVITSIVAGEQAFGLLGMVVAVPLVTVVKETARLLLEHRRTLTRARAPAPVAPDPVHFVC
jgi:predicted PurR-regulated permease PerM